MLRKRRNSYVPAVAGMVTVHERVVTPEPTYTYCRYVVFGADIAASASQSYWPL